jgi:uncharacterized protein (TIGR00730 family)
VTAGLTAVCVFCGSNRGTDPQFERVAQAVGRLIAGQGLTLVYGGAQLGLMGTVANAALAAGGRVVGIIPRNFSDLEVPHHNLSEVVLVGSMHERKALMAERSDAFFVLPGGLGTLEEAAETMSWTQLGLQGMPTGFLNVNGFYDPLLAQLDRMVEQGFVRPEMRAGIYADDSPERLLARLADFEPPAQHKWIDLEP